jgi:hypothetical protein
VNRPAPDTQVDAIDGNKAGKILGEILGFEDQLFTHAQQAPRRAFLAGFRHAARPTKVIRLRLSA